MNFLKFSHRKTALDRNVNARESSNFKSAESNTSSQVTQQSAGSKYYITMSADRSSILADVALTKSIRL